MEPKTYTLVSIASMRRPSLVITAAIAAAGVLVGGYYLYQAKRSGFFDARLQSALEAVEGLRSYEAQVDTSTALSDRTIAVSGLYRLDFDANRYGSYATTTLTIPTEKPSKRSHAFTFQNISIGNEIFVRIDTDSQLLRQTIPHDARWHRFSADSIPQEFTDIAVSGPVLDNLALLSKRGRYLSLNAAPAERMYENHRYYVYEFSLSNEASEVQGGTLQSLIQRIGDGHVFVWINEQSQVQLMTFSGENYFSTTTIQSVNTPVNVATPEVLE